MKQLTLTFTAEFSPVTDTTPNQWNITEGEDQALYTNIGPDGCKWTEIFNRLYDDYANQGYPHPHKVIAAYLIEHCGIDANQLQFCIAEDGLIRYYTV